MKARKPALTSPITPSTRATISSGRWRAEQRHRDHPHAEHQHPEQQRAFVRRPRRRRSGSAAAARCSNASPRTRTEKSLVTNDAGEAAEGERDEQRTAPAPPAARAPSRRRCRCAAPASGRTACTSASGEGERRGRTVRARESWLAFVTRLLRPSAPASTACGRLGRHVVLVVLGEHLARAEHAVGAELALRHHAFAFAEQVRQRCRDRPPGWSSRCRSR